MFGKGWKPAQATVVDCDYTRNQYGPWYVTMMLDVHPPDESPFRTQVKVNTQGFDTELRHFIPPKPGDSLQLEYKPKSHDVRVLVDPAHDRRVAEEAREQAWEAALQAQPGTEMPSLQAPQAVAAADQPHVVIMGASATGLPPDTLEKLEQLKAQGLLTEQQFEAAKSQVQSAGGPPQAAQGSGVAERLQRLEQLREQHLISDEEYAAERQRILDSI